MAKFCRRPNLATAPVFLLDQICSIHHKFPCAGASTAVTRRSLAHGSCLLTKSSPSKRKPLDCRANGSKAAAAASGDGVGPSAESGGPARRRFHHSQTDKPTASSIRERNITVSSYYNQTAIDIAAEKV